VNESSSQHFGASTQAIRAHYDLSNDFYRTWLDETMTYTAALWDHNNPSDNLLLAQQRKIDFAAQQIFTEDTTSILDIGCGWGGALAHMQQYFNLKNPVGITISQAQYEWIKSKHSNVKVHLERWENYHTDEKYDGIISVEAIEAFVKPGMTSQAKIDIYRHLFKKCRYWLKDNGRFFLQCICYENSFPKDLDEFIKNEIFPESDLPRLAELAAGWEYLFEPVNIANHRLHYVQTLRAWLKNMRDNKENLVKEFGDSIYMRYLHYLKLSEYMFSNGNCSLLRITLQRINHSREEEK